MESFAVLHEGLDSVGVEGAGEAFVGGLYAFDDGECHEVLGEVGVDIEHALGLFFGLL